MFKPSQRYLRCIFTLLFSLHSSFSLFAEPEFYLKNYTKQEYQAASQNWSVTQDGNGYMYFANNVGLLEFDGITWTLYPAPNGNIIRAVAADKDNRILPPGTANWAIGNVMPLGGSNIAR